MESPTRRRLLGSTGALLGAALVGPTSARAQTAADWPMFGYDPQNTATSPTVGPKRSMSRAWSVGTDDAVQSAPTVVNGRIYVGSDDGNVYAVDQVDGESQWTFETGGSVSGAPAVADGTLYVGSADGTLYALDIAAQEMAWTYETGDGIEASPTVVDGTVFFGSDDSYLHAVDADDGTATWTFETGGIITSTPAVSSGTVFVGSADGRIYAVAADSGTERWSYDTDNGVNSSPAVASGTVYASSSDGHLYALDASAGELSWRFALNGIGGTSPAVADGVVYATEGIQGTRIHAIDAVTGERRWSGKTGASVRSSPAVADGVVYVASTDRYVYGIDTREGELLWRLSPGGSITASPAVVGDTVYIGSTDGNLYALRGATDRATPTATATPSPSPLPSQTTRVPTSADDGGFPFLPAALGAAGLGGGGLWWYRSRSGSDSDDRAADADEGPSTPTAPTDADRSASDRGGAPTVSGSAPDGDAPTPDPSSVLLEGERREPDPVQSVPAASFTYDDLLEEATISERDTGTVTRARVTTDGIERTVAVARPRLSGTVSADTLGRLVDEVETWRKLDDHDHIVTVVEHGSRPLPWVAMEYLEGGDLAERRGDLDLLQSVWTARAIVTAVYHAHRRGVHHLHLTPGNVLFEPRADAWDVPKVSDWWRGAETARSVSGRALRYAAPEQIDDGYGALDDITDVYQVGALLYELFTGRPPFDESVKERPSKIVEQGPRSPSAISDVPPALDGILHTALKTEKADRYDSLVYFRDALRELYER
jgi:outer membrane protein assembly factor BamB